MSLTEGYEHTRATAGVLEELHQERRRQDAKWGEQNHPIAPASSHVHYAAEVDDARFACEHAAKAGSLTWDLILIEEVLEALAESDPAKCRAELVQVGAVVVAMIESIDRAAKP